MDACFFGLVFFSIRIKCFGDDIPHVYWKASVKVVIAFGKQQTFGLFLRESLSCTFSHFQGSAFEVDIPHFYVHLQNGHGASIKK